MMNMTAVRRFATLGLGLMGVYYGTRCVAQVAVELERVRQARPDDELAHAVNEAAHKLDPAAGAPHPFVGEGWDACLLCRCPLAHPIHRERRG